MRAAQRVGIGPHQLLGEDLHHLPQQVDICSFELLAELLQDVNPVPDHRAPPLGDPTDLVEDDAVVFPFNDLQIVVRTPRPRTLLMRG